MAHIVVVSSRSFWSLVGWPLLFVSISSFSLSLPTRLVVTKKIFFSYGTYVCAPVCVCSLTAMIFPLQSDSCLATVANRHRKVLLSDFSFLSLSLLLTVTLSLIILVHELTLSVSHTPLVCHTSSLLHFILESACVIGINYKKHYCPMYMQCLLYSEDTLVFFSPGAQVMQMISSSSSSAEA